MSAHRLYTPDVLAAAVSLAARPLTDDLPWRGEARSTSCGSRIELGLSMDDDGRITTVGMTSRACAIGQASAAIFADHVVGLTPGEIASSRARMAKWLAGEGPMPEWPGLAIVAAARDYPARHGAMMLAWDAAVAALDREPRAVA